MMLVDIVSFDTFYRLTRSLKFPGAPGLLRHAVPRNDKEWCHREEPTKAAAEAWASRQLAMTKSGVIARSQHGRRGDPGNPRKTPGSPAQSRPCYNASAA